MQRKKKGKSKTRVYETITVDMNCKTNETLKRGYPQITSHVKGRGGGRRSMTLYDKGGGGAKFCNITFLLF